MKKKFNWNVYLLTIIVCLLPMIFGTFIYDSLPDKIPGHWGLNGQPDRYDPKWVIIYVLPAIMVVFQTLICAVTDLTKKDPEAKNPKAHRVIRWIIPVITVAVETVTFIYVFNPEINVGKILCMVIGVLWVLIGNYMPKISYEDGLNSMKILPKDKDDYKKMMRIGGYAFVISGLITAIVGIFDEIVAFGVLVGSTIAVAVISLYYTFKK